MAKKPLNESEKKKNYTITLSPELHDEIEQLAKRRYLSFSQTVTIALLEYKEKFDSKSEE